MIRRRNGSFDRHDRGDHRCRDLLEFPPRFPDESPRIDEASPFGVELRRRQELAAATIPFRGGAIRFEAGSDRIMERSEPALSSIVAELERDTALKLLVKGFTDPREEDSVRLSVERARAVVDWLVERGISMERLELRLPNPPL